MNTGVNTGVARARRASGYKMWLYERGAASVINIAGLVWRAGRERIDEAEKSARAGKEGA